VLQEDAAEVVEEEEAVEVEVEVDAVVVEVEVVVVVEVVDAVGSRLAGEEVEVVVGDFKNY